MYLRLAAQLTESIQHYNIYIAYTSKRLKKAYKLSRINLVSTSLNHSSRYFSVSSNNVHLINFHQILFIFVEINLLSTAEDISILNIAYFQSQIININQIKKPQNLI